MAEETTPVYWDEVEDPALVSWVPGPSRLLAVWPSRVNADCCFEKAGFREWNDGVPEAEEEFRGLVARVVRHFETTEVARLREGEVPVRARGLWATARDFFRPAAKRPAPPGIIEVLVVAGENDQFPPCVVTFGDPPHTALQTSDGHGLLWVRIGAAHEPSGVLEAAGRGRATRRTLDWKILVPSPQKKLGTS